MKNDKTDKGFEIFYKNLSYRRKFIRTLWLAPFIALAIFFLIGENIILNIIKSIFFITIFFIQLIYNYLKWKKEV